MARIVRTKSAVATAILLGMVCFLPACSLHLEAPLLPNVKGSVGGTDGKLVNTSIPLLQTSQQDAANDKKVWKWDVDIDTSVQQAGMVDSVNCVQLVQLGSGAQVIDFSNAKCPGNEQLADPATLVLTLTFSQVTANTDYSVSFNNVVVGHLWQSSGFPLLLLTELCTGDYANTCKLGLDGSGRFTGISVTK